MFTSAKVAQMAAFFSDKEENAKINILKLIKLMYLADRESMCHHGHPISFDNMVSMQYGPVLSQTFDLINGFVRGPAAEVWDDWLSDRKDHFVGLRRKFERNDLNQLSDADLRVLEGVWNRFGGMDQWQLVTYTHQHCPEWTDPKNSAQRAIRIDEIDVFRALGIEEKEAAELAKEIRIEKSLDEVFAQS